MRFIDGCDWSSYFCWHYKFTWFKTLSSLGSGVNPWSTQIIQTMQRLKFVLLTSVVFIVAITYFLSLHLQFKAPLAKSTTEIQERHFYEIHSWQGKFNMWNPNSDNRYFVFDVADWIIYFRWIACGVCRLFLFIIKKKTSDRIFSIDRSKTIQLNKKNAFAKRIELLFTECFLPIQRTVLTT